MFYHDYCLSCTKQLFSSQGAVEVTGTFKQMKVKLVEQGFDPGQIQDPLFVLDDREKSYVTMTTEMYNSIISGNIKL
uniref:S27A2 synthetase n=1 Tax=Periophthalmus magnuspinnatus TaxID=409849 RepID=A0A3B4BER0_9GOBI